MSDIEAIRRRRILQVQRSLLAHLLMHPGIITDEQVDRMLAIADAKRQEGT